MRPQVWKSLRAEERWIRSKITVFTLLFYVSVSAVVIELVTIFAPSGIAKREDLTQMSTAPQAVRRVDAVRQKRSEIVKPSPSNFRLDRN